MDYDVAFRLANNESWKKKWNFEIFVFLVQTYKEIMQKLFNFF